MCWLPCALVSLLPPPQKPANVLLDAEGRACLADLGLALALGTGAATAVGFSRQHAAPEMLLGQRCTLAADM